MANVICSRRRSEAGGGWQGEGQLVSTQLTGDDCEDYDDHENYNDYIYNDNVEAGSLVQCNSNESPHTQKLDTTQSQML